MLPSHEIFCSSVRRGIFKLLKKIPVACSLPKRRVVIKSRGPGIFPGYYESGPRLLLLENRRKIEPKEIPSRLIPRLLVLFTRQLEILVTTLQTDRISVVIEPLILNFRTCF